MYSEQELRIVRKTGVFACGCGKATQEDDADEELDEPDHNGSEGASKRPAHTEDAQQMYHQNQSNTVTMVLAICTNMLQNAIATVATIGAPGR